MRTFSRTTEKLSKEDKDKLHYKLKQLLVIGTELETQHKDIDKRRELKTVLQPTGNYYAIPDNLVVDIKTDGSLHTNGNVEVIMIGDNSSFEETRDKYAYVEDTMKNMGFYCDNECGQHISALTIKPVRINGIVLKNIYQLTKLFSPEITRLMAVGSNGNYFRDTIIRKGALTYAKWNYNNLTASNKDLKTFIEQANKENGSGGKYGFFNFYKSGLIPNSDDVGELFIEYRVPDRCMIPSISTSWNFLVKAIILKSVTLSQSGVLTFSDDEWAKKKDLMNDIYSKSCKDIEENAEFKDSTMEFLEYLKPEFESMNAMKAYKILEYLVENPLFGKNIMCLTKEEVERIEKEETEDTDFRINPEHYLRYIVCGEKKPEKDTATKEKIKDELILGVSAEDDEGLINYLAEKTGVTPATIKKYLDEYESGEVVRTKKSYILRN